MSEGGLSNHCLGAVWVAAFLVSEVLVAWQLCGDLDCAWQLWKWRQCDHFCFATDFPIAILTFEGILLATVAFSVQRDGNKIFDRVAANHKTVVSLVLLILFSAGTSGFALLHYTLTPSGGKVCISLTPGCGLIALFSFFSFVWTLWIWGLLLLSSMVHETKSNCETDESVLTRR